MANYEYPYAAITNYNSQISAEAIKEATRKFAESLTAPL